MLFHSRSMPPSISLCPTFRQKLASSPTMFSCQSGVMSSRSARRTGTILIVSRYEQQFRGVYLIKPMVFQQIARVQPRARGLTHKWQTVIMTCSNSSLISLAISPLLPSPPASTLPTHWSRALMSAPPTQASSPSSSMILAAQPCTNACTCHSVSLICSAQQVYSSIESTFSRQSTNSCSISRIRSGYQYWIYCLMQGTVAMARQMCRNRGNLCRFLWQKLGNEDKMRTISGEKCSCFSITTSNNPSNSSSQSIPPQSSSPASSPPTTRSSTHSYPISPSPPSTTPMIRTASITRCSGPLRRAPCISSLHNRYTNQSSCSPDRTTSSGICQMYSLRTCRQGQWWVGRRGSWVVKVGRRHRRSRGRVCGRRGSYYRRDRQWV